MLYSRIFYHGTLAGVTDSCHGLWAKAEASFLIDCDLFQRADSSGSVSRLEYLLDTVRALIAAHIYIRYLGQISSSLAAAFRELCSKAAAALLPIVLEGAFKLLVSQKEVERYIALVQQRITAAAYDHWFTLSDSAEVICGVRLQRAGHILRLDFVEVDLAYPKNCVKKRVLFSGDFGAPLAQLMPAPWPPYGAVILGLESTYSDRQHENRPTRRQRLKHFVDQAIEENGTGFIRAFSIGRTPKLPYKKIIGRLHATPDEEGARRRDVSTKTSGFETSSPKLFIIFDSLLASRLAAAYRQLQPFWNKEAPECINLGRRLLGFEQLITVKRHRDHISMVQHLVVPLVRRSPLRVITCSSGRIVSYLKAMLRDKGTTCCS
ncbi:MBL fold metallo-hydrolase [Stutzerimonas stutzeri]|uniref:MBL fold metallo-hydrolase n=1 Tax=Stutzerimonas stutzeri TaxID=316 RepID=UPI00147B61B6|nr:MBL fold metallo-hydrolase [Stutzerimonas stutzeri]WRQ01538.1 MBL fold metallo-hydrolase [Stutzerimonas stutzeri]